MPRYFFHLSDRLGVLRDNKGVELASLDDAKAMALQRARDEISESSKHRTLGLNRSIEILDGGGQHLFSLRFEDAVERDAVKPKD